MLFPATGVTDEPIFCGYLDALGLNQENIEVFMKTGGSTFMFSCLNVPPEMMPTESKKSKKDKKKKQKKEKHEKKKARKEKKHKKTYDEQCSTGQIEGQCET